MVDIAKEGFKTILYLFFFIFISMIVYGVECGSNPTNDCAITTNTIFAPGTYNLSEGIEIRTDNTALDCNNAELVGNGTNSFYWKNGIYIGGKNITIKNCRIRNYHMGISIFNSEDIIIENNIIYSNIHYGIDISDSPKSTIIKNIIYLNDESMDIDDSPDNILQSNFIYSNEYGIDFYNSTNNTLKNNTITNTTYWTLFFEDGCNNNIDSSNFGGDGTKPILYMKDTKEINLKSLSNYSEIILCNVSNSTMDNLSISNGKSRNGGLTLYESDNNIIQNSNFSNVLTTGFLYSDNNTISNNILGGNLAGVYILGGKDNKIIQNTISNNKNDVGTGIFLGTLNTFVSMNNISYNTHGIYYLAYVYENNQAKPTYNNITKNNIFNNTNSSIYLVKNVDEGDEEPSINLSVDNNYWGTTNCEEINTSFIIVGNTSNITITFQPFLDTPYPNGKPRNCLLCFNISLNKGWNLISLPLNSTNFTQTFAPIKSFFNSMFSFDAKEQDFVEIDPYSPIEVNLSGGAWLNVSTNANLEVCGKEFNPKIDLFNGWNLIGYPSLDSSLINLSSYNTSIIYIYNNSKWFSYIPKRKGDSLEYFHPGYGYWVNTKNETSLTFP